VGGTSGGVRRGAIALALAAGFAVADERANYFNDPFVQVTRGIADCPVPEGPMITRAEMRAQAHSRTERGTSCYLAGRCRLPNSYLYDKEIIPRVQMAILADGRFAETSIWLEGQRRWVWIKGCVRHKDQAKALERLVRGIDDVEAVIDQVVVRKR
jgi:BON domain